MTVCRKCGSRWELRDSTYEEEKYSMCYECIEKARKTGEIPPKPKFDGTPISLLELFRLVEKK